MIFTRTRRTKPTLAAALLAVLTVSVAAPIALAPAAYAATGTLTGTVFNDYDADGVKDTGEPGVGGAIVYAYDTAGAQFGPATSNASGAYTLNLTGAAAGALRVELQTIPSGYQPTRVGTDNASTIRFTTFTGSSPLSVGS